MIKLNKTKIKTLPPQVVLDAQVKFSWNQNIGVLRFVAHYNQGQSFTVARLSKSETFGDLNLAG